MKTNIVGTLNLESLNRKEIAPGVFAIGEPQPRPDLGPNIMVCLADVHGMMCLVELSVHLLQRKSTNA